MLHDLYACIDCRIEMCIKEENEHMESDDGLLCDEVMREDPKELDKEAIFQLTEANSQLADAVMARALNTMSLENNEPMEKKRRPISELLGLDPGEVSPHRIYDPKLLVQHCWQVLKILHQVRIQDVGAERMSTGKLVPKYGLWNRLMRIHLIRQGYNPGEEEWKEYREKLGVHLLECHTRVRHVIIN